MMFTQKVKPLPWTGPNTKTGNKMTHMTLSHKKKGFTLIEMIIVFVLIGILVGLGIPHYKYSTWRAKEAILKEDLFNLRMLINQYYTDKGRYPGYLQTLVDEEYLRTIPIDPMTDSSETWIEVQQTPTEEDLIQGFEIGIVDVLSGSDKKALDGTLYNTW